LQGCRTLGVRASTCTSDASCHPTTCLELLTDDRV
jgi:hypothetical protein